ncbi:autophagy-related protein 13 homolog [Condylostylus longicornis]|uniref:autophagy-related protein 13 homolog n=1 Tax=Condylostylus longicornis TaxID=2530218 RepID=UPI00244DEF5E|nr:autophagy-related protein 13 homolog [Condylostylus longicornis]
MSTVKIIAGEKDLEKYFKFLTFKMVQVIVQSRLGEVIKTPSNPNGGGNDWFNIVIIDHPDVLAETKKALNLTATETILQRLPLCVEISLKTVEGDAMILEVWSLGLVSEQIEPMLKASQAIYNRMGILLKSLISITRATPAYKLSRRQSPDSYSIYYRVYVDEPQIHNLGEGNKQVRIGQLSTSVGTLNMSVAYRTKMTISPTQTGRDNAIMLKSDHFLKDLSPKHIRYHNIKKSEKKIIDLDKPLRPGAFVDTTKLKQFTEEDYILPETPPFSWLIRRTKEESSQETSVEDDRSSSNLNSPVDKVPTPLTTGTTTILNATTTTTTNTTTNNNNANFKNCEQNCQDGSGTGGKIQQQQQNGGQTKDVSGTSPIRSLLVAAPVEDLKKKNLNKSKLSQEDENLLKELHFPFASVNTHMGDLAKFYRDCYNAPPLQSCTDPQTVETEIAVDDLSKQLEQFETSLDDYETLVKSIGCSLLDSNSNS